MSPGKRGAVSVPLLMVLAKSRAGMSDSVRSVHRALMLIRLMNRRDSWTLQQISADSSLAKPTVYRLLHTLIDEGYVHMPPGKVGVYRLTSKVRELGAGLTSYTIFADLAEPIVIDATRQMDWPASFAMPDPPFMRIVSCGMPYSREHSAKPTSVGREHWMFSSAVGAAYLSQCGDTQLQLCHQAAVRHRLRDGNASPVPSLPSLQSAAEHTRNSGYALRIAKPTDVNSAMAVPVHVGDWAIGAIACSTFPRSLSAEFIRRALPQLIVAARRIAEACSVT